MSDPLVAQLTALILEACEKDAPPGGLHADEPLFGAETRLQLDSLDALQISMAIQKQYGLRMADSKETRRALSSIAHLADYLVASGISPGAQGTTPTA
ncbi:phosphopantetheine-binding protein [Uliginosibacterium sp. H1]|uniref:phosphopantetheine-binding protein n=1 Tax=Uliginosibacterium sp. H1 TaxID=3114757 RepID=UPI002E196960|nr:phosphopantetheine-binding protein [Uliginosibacterium sp. H1]